jgi:hypothetical protein
MKLIDGFIDARGDCIGTGFMRTSLKSPFDIILFKLEFTNKKLTIKRFPYSQQAEEAYGTAPAGKGKAFIVGHSLSGKGGDMLFIEWTY